MNFTHYLTQFQKAAEQLDKKLLVKKQIEVAVVVVLDSVCLKLYKKSWASPLQDALTAESRIFFSVWITENAIKEKKLLYNIHALKLRQLKGYSIESRKFAEAFRTGFKKHELDWQNVSVAFGPLTLMQGFVNLDESSLQKDIVLLANQFLKIEYLIDELLEQYKKLI
jgi:hypothetical protein